MEPTTYISLEAVCKGYQIERDFALTLQENGLIKFKTQQSILHVHCDELPRLEKIIRFQRDLNVNLEGIEVILNLLNRLEALNDEVRNLKNRIYIYEGG